MTICTSHTMHLLYQTVMKTQSDSFITVEMSKQGNVAVYSVQCILLVVVELLAVFTDVHPTKLNSNIPIQAANLIFFISFPSSYIAKIIIKDFF